MTIIAVDGLSEEAFRRSIESRLRRGLAKEATSKLRNLLAPYAGSGGILPDRFLKVLTGDLNLVGWERLGEALIRHDQPERPVTAVSIAFGWPGEDPPQPDSQGLLAPLIETSFFTDEAFPFSQSSREDLLDGYSYHGCSWADEGIATEPLLSLQGIDDLHGALVALESRLLDSEEPDPEEIRAGSLGACLLSALLYQAVGEHIARDGLPRPLCVLAGSNGVYPYFDAPVIGMPEDVLRNEELLSQVPGPRYSSLLVTGIPRARKRAVLVLDESESERELRTADLRNLAHGAGSALPEQAAPAVPGDLPVPPEGGIIPISNGPLMVKKKPSESWDFRDMLGPRDPDSPPVDQFGADRLDQPDSEPVGPEPEETMPGGPDSEQSASPEPPLEIEAPAPFVPRDPAFDLPPQSAQPISVATPEPGFSLLETKVRERLDALVAEPAPPHFETAEPELLLDVPVLEEPVVEPEFGTLPEGPVWCFGIGYLEDAEEAAVSVPEPPQAPQHPNTGLWSRLRKWLKPR